MRITASSPLSNHCELLNFLTGHRLYVFEMAVISFLVQMLIRLVQAERLLDLLRAFDGRSKRR